MACLARKLARAAGEKRFEATPCPVCQTTAYYTSNGQCVKCSAVRRAKWKPSKPPAVFREAIAQESQYSKEADAVAAQPYKPMVLRPWPPSASFGNDNMHVRD